MEDATHSNGHENGNGAGPKSEPDLDMTSNDARDIKPRLKVNTRVAAVKAEEGVATNSAQSTPMPEDPPPLAVDTSGMSARELNRLKRKRKPGNTAFIAAPSPIAQSSKSNNAPPSAGPPPSK